MTDEPLTFRERVWELVRAIPPGHVMTYGQISHALGAARAARIVGGALHSLPAENDVPWHRVVNRLGQIVTAAREHHAVIQAERLRAEGVPVDERLALDLPRYLWWPDEATLEALKTPVEARFLLDEWAARADAGRSGRREPLGRGRGHWVEHPPGGDR